MSKMDNDKNKNHISFDTYKVGKKTYMKQTFGPKTWQTIQSQSPGRFVDVLEAAWKNPSKISGKFYK